MEIIKKEPEQEPAKEKKHQILVELDEGDAAMLRAFTGHSGKAKVQVLRECLRYVYRLQFGAGAVEKGGAA